MTAEGALRTAMTQRFMVREAQGAVDMARVVAFRDTVFRAGQSNDADGFDPVCRHFMILDTTSGALVCVFRVLLLRDGRDICQSYAAQHYDLSRLMQFDGAMLELGRFCARGARIDPDILRLAWGVIAALVDRNAVGLLFGCSSFRGASAVLHQSGLGALREFVAPAALAPLRKISAETIALPASGEARHLPPLLRSYLQMGGWVSDHAVIDRDLDTVHVFTGVEIAKIPPVRAKLLRRIAAQIA